MIVSFDDGFHVGFEVTLLFVIRSVAMFCGTPEITLSILKWL